MAIAQGDRIVPNPHSSQDTFDIVKNTRRSLIHPVVAIFLISNTIIFGLAVYAVRGLDQVSVDKSSHLAASVFADIEERIKAQNYDYAYWDQAVENLVTKYNPIWADENIGSYLFESFDITASYVIDDQNNVRYGMAKGERVDFTSLSSLPSGIDTLIARARTASKMDETPVPTAGYVRDGDRLYLASATRLTTYRTVDDKDIIESTRWMLLVMKEIEGEALSRLEKRYLLHDLRVEIMDTASNDSTSMALHDIDGKIVGALQWRTDLPGTQVLIWLVPSAFVSFFIMVGLIIISIQRATRASQAYSDALLANRNAELERQFAQAQKMQSFGIMVGGVAHNFNNLLQPILMLALMMRKRAPEGSPDKNDLDVIIEACNKAADIVKQISDFTREHAPHEKRCHDIFRIIDQGCRLAASTIPSSITMVTELDPDMGVVAGDEVDTQTVLMNLISNAVDAMMGKPGTLTVRLSKIVIDKTVSNRPQNILDGEYAKLTVSDTGTGMEQGVLAQAFDPFYTTKDVGRGTGLGLSSVYGIVMRQGGSIHIDSTPNVGTTFSVYIPLHDELECQNHTQVQTYPHESDVGSR